MADEGDTDEKSEKKERGDQTAELELAELELFENPTGEIRVEDLEPMDRPPPVPPGPTPGLGRPKPPPPKKKGDTTLHGVKAPEVETPVEPTEPVVDLPPPREEAGTVPPPPRPGGSKSAKAPTEPLRPKTPSVRPPAREPKKPAGAAAKPPVRPKSMPPPRPSAGLPPKVPAKPIAQPVVVKPIAQPAGAKASTAEAVAKPSAAEAVVAQPIASVASKPAAQPAAPQISRAVVNPPSRAEQDTDAEGIDSPPHTENEEREAAESLRDLCIAQLETETDPDRKAALSYELGRLNEVSFGDIGKAAEHYQAALRSRGDHAASLRGARRALAQTDRHAALPALYDAEVAVTRSPTDRARLLYTKARVMEEHLRQIAPALNVYREALKLDPGNLVVLKAVERSLRRDKAWGPLAKTYEQLANAVKDPALRAAWTALRANITETKLGDPVQAAALYEAAIEADPNATSALANAKRLGTEQKRWPQLVEALLTEHSLTEDEPTRLAILVTIAGIEERRMGDAEASIETLENALEASPREPSILRELSRLHRASGRHAKEVEALTQLVELTNEKDAKARLSHRIGHLYEQMLGDADRAKPWFERTLLVDPSHRAAALALVHLLEASERWSEVIAVWEKRASDGVSSVKERAELHHRIGNLLERKVGKPVEAGKQHATALGLDPDHHEAFASLTRIYTAAGRWSELAELYERAVDGAKHEAEAIMWLFRLAAIREDRLDDPKGALAAYVRVLERNPNHLGALHALERAGSRAGEYPRVVEALRKEAGLTQDRDRSAALLHRAAVLTAEELGDPSAAMRAIEDLLRRQPQHRNSLETLATLLSDAGRWRELVGVYTRLLPLTSTANEKVRLHYRMGEILETQIGNDVEAITAYRATLQLDPDFEPARDALISGLRRTEDWEALVKALEERLTRLPTAIDRARGATELGTVYEERLDKRDEALEMFEKAIEAAPLHRPALDARERLLTEAGEWNRLYEALELEAEECEDPFLSLQTSLRAALIRAEQQGATGPALDAFRPVFELHPDHIGALLAVEEIYARTRDDAGLAATYEKMIGVVSDPKAKLASLHELARACAASDTDTTGVQRRILALAPDDAEALEELAYDAALRGDGNTELAMHARLASTASDPRVGAYHQTRVGEILLGEGDSAGALGAFRAAIGLDATSLGATRGLSRAALRAKDASALRFAATRERDVTKDRHVAVGLLLQAALHDLMAERQDDAAASYEAALELDPGNERAASGLKATLGRPDQAAQLIDLLSQAATASKKPARTADLHLSVAALHAEMRDDLAAAVAAARRALGTRPNDSAGLSALSHYLERSGQWGAAVDAIEKLLPKAKEDELIEAHLRLAKIADRQLGDTERAARSLRAVLQRDEDNGEALAGLVRLERIRGRHEEALRLAKKLLQVVTDVARKADVLTELAELERARNQDGAAATHAFGALGIQGPSGRAAEVYKELIAAAPEHATWDNYATGLMTHLERKKAGGGRGVAATYQELAWVFTEAHNRPDRAIATLREGVEACPQDAAISLALVKALRELKANDKAIGELRRYIGLDAWQPKAWRELANVLRTTGEPDGAAVALAPVVAMKQATEQEESIVRGRRVHAAQAPGGILGRQGLSQIIDDGGLEESASVLVHALSDVFGKLEGFDHERWGVSKRDRIKQGDGHPLRAFADRIGMTFGVPEYELYVVDSPEIEWACAYAGSPPVLVVPTRIETKRDPVLAFHLARPLALMSRLLHPVDRIDPMLLERILIGAARQFEPDFSLHATDSDLEAETRRVGKAIGFFSRGKIQDAATTFAATPTPNIGHWQRDVRRMGARAALLVCDDLLAAYEAMGDDLGPDGLVADLARFWVSDPAMRFRRRVAQQI